MDKNLDIWAVQRIGEELEVALGNIKSDNDLILYTNLTCDFNIGGIQVKSRQFDKVIYSEENDVLIMFMREGVVDISDVKKYLDDRKLNYSEVTFAPSVSEYVDQFDLEIWFAREQLVLDDAVADSLAKGVDSKCDYFPFLDSRLDLGYITNNTSDKYNVDGRKFRGMVRMPDKLVLFVNGDKTKDITASQVSEVVKKYNLECNVLENNDFTLDIESMSKLHSK